MNMKRRAENDGEAIKHCEGVTAIQQLKDGGADDNGITVEET